MVVSRVNNLRSKFITEKRQHKINRKRLNGVYKPKNGLCEGECYCDGECNDYTGTDSISGEGVISYLSDKFSKFNVALKGRPKLINELMESTKGIPVVGVSVIRQPITQIFETILNKLTFGKLKSKMNELGYDKLFHLYIKFDLANGKSYMMEKNQRVMIRSDPPNKDAEISPVTTLTDGKDIKGYFETLESKNIKDIYVYSAFTTNCQHFVRSILNANGITKYDSFISQNTEVLAPSVLQRVAKGITGLAGVIDVAYRGGNKGPKGSRYPEGVYAVNGSYGEGFLTGFLTPDVDLEQDMNRYANFAGDAYSMMDKTYDLRNYDNNFSAF
jgi:hypothetical protein